MIRRLLWDAEFSPNTVLSWRVGRKINIPADNILVERQIISIAWKWHSEKRVHSLNWGEAQDDRDLLTEFNEVLNESDEAIAHFGDGYDWPMFRARCAIRGLATNPLLRTVDTCKMARKLGFNSRSLDYLGKVLGVGKKLDTGFGLWKRVVVDNDPIALKKMERYNRHDVFPLLQGVYDKLSAISPVHTHVGVLNGGEKWTCPRDGSEHVKVSKTRVTALGTVQKQFQCLDCGGYYKTSLKAHNEYVEHLMRKRQ